MSTSCHTDMSLIVRDCCAHQVLSRENEIAIARMTKPGYSVRQRHSALKKLIECNFRLVVNIAAAVVRRYHGVEVDDLFQEGYKGLTEAVKRFDPERGIKFSTYASFWIKMTIMVVVQSRWLIRLPAWVSDRYAKCNRGAAETRTEQLFSIEPTCETATSIECAARVQSDYAFEQPKADELEELPDYRTDETEVIRTAEENHKLVQYLLSRLDARDRDVVERRMRGELLWEIGDALKITRERARQIHNEALAKMRRITEEEQLQ